MKTILKYLCLTSCILLTACSKKEAPPAELEAITEVLKEVQMAIDFTDPDRLRKVSALSVSATQYQLGSSVNGMYIPTIEKVEVQSYTDEEVVVIVTIYHKDASGDLVDMRFNSERKLIKKNGAWKIRTIKDGERVPVTD